LNPAEIDEDCKNHQKSASTNFDLLSEFFGKDVNFLLESNVISSGRAKNGDDEKQAERDKSAALVYLLPAPIFLLRIEVIFQSRICEDAESERRTRSCGVPLCWQARHAINFIKYIHLSLVGVQHAILYCTRAHSNLRPSAKFKVRHHETKNSF